MVFHYGQAIFEGMKAYRGKDDQIFLFRPKDNFETDEQLGPADVHAPPACRQGIENRSGHCCTWSGQWIPAAEGASLYIRPTMIAVDPYLGVRPSETYWFYVILSPVGAYYTEGFNPTRIYVSDEHVRAVKGGVGNVKTAGNYAASLYHLAGGEEGRLHPGALAGCL
jgi:branched-chain amino acid aminotransferase